MVDEKAREDLDVIAKAHLAAERLEKANEINAELIKRMEAMEARRVLGGQSSAGQPLKPEYTEEEKLKIGMQRYFKGSALEPVLK